MSETAVEYRNVDGFPGYRVGDDGTVWSRFRRQSSPCQPRTIDGPWELRKLQPMKKGYLRIELYRNGHHVRVLVHHLVLGAFVGPRPSGLECCHGDGNTSNNRLGNLRWGTKVENQADRAKHGHARTWSKLTVEDVKQVRRLRAEGHTPAAIALVFKVTAGTIQHIIKGRQWKGVV